jgi:hypothetical protein
VLARSQACPLVRSVLCLSSLPPRYVSEDGAQERTRVGCETSIHPVHVQSNLSRCSMSEILDCHPSSAQSEGVTHSERSEGVWSRADSQMPGNLLGRTSPGLRRICMTGGPRPLSEQKTEYSSLSQRNKQGLEGNFIGHFMVPIGSECPVVAFDQTVRLWMIGRCIHLNPRRRSTSVRTEMHGHGLTTPRL